MKVHIVKAMIFPAVMYGCESWTKNKAECWRIDAFKLWCWRRLLRASWTARRSNQSILKKINPEYSLEGLMLKLKLQYLGHLIWRDDSLEKSLMLGKIEGRRRRGRQNEMFGWHHRLKGHESEQTPGDSEGQGSLVSCTPWDCKVGHDFLTEQQQPCQRHRQEADRLGHEKGLNFHSKSNGKCRVFFQKSSNVVWFDLIFFSFFLPAMPWNVWILVPCPGIELTAPAVAIPSPNQWPKQLIS